MVVLTLTYQEQQPVLPSLCHKQLAKTYALKTVLKQLVHQEKQPVPTTLNGEDSVTPVNQHVPLPLSVVIEIRYAVQQLLQRNLAQHQKALINSLVLVIRLFQELAHNMGLMFVQLQ
jgi:hypothetical protein